MPGAPHILLACENALNHVSACSAASSWGHGGAVGIDIDMPLKGAGAFA